MKLINVTVRDFTYAETKNSKPEGKNFSEWIEELIRIGLKNK